MDIDHPIRTEIILDADGNFYRRNIQEAIIADAAITLRNAVNVEPYIHSFVPSGFVNFDENNKIIPHYRGLVDSRLPYTFSQAKEETGARQTARLNVFFQIGRKGFPLPRAILQPCTRASDFFGTPVFYPMSYDLWSRSNESDSAVPKDVFYMNSDYSMFICFKNITLLDKKAFSSRLVNVQETTTVYLFGIHKETNQVVTFNLPNIYDDGRICTGRDFQGEQNRTYYTHELPELLSHLMNVIYTAPFNEDLRMSPRQEQSFVLFTEQGYSVDPKLMARFRTELCNDASSNQFFRPITNELLIDFAQCRKSTVL